MTEQQHDDISDNDIVEMLLEGGKVKTIARETGTTEWRVRRLRQQLLDVGRIQRNNDRAYDRAHTSVLNLLESVWVELRKAGKGLAAKGKPRVRPDKAKPVAVVTISDTHFNEIICEEGNLYDMDIASKRLALLASRVRLYAKANGCSKVVVCLTGDLVNSNRRMDELLAMATSRARAVVLAAHMLGQFILDLRSDFVVDVASVSGNESRIEKDLCWSDVAASDNFDMTIHYMLEQLLAHDRYVTFLDPDPNVKIIKIHKQTIALVHGTTLKCEDQKSVQSFIGKWSQESGSQVTHVFAGHIHATLISDYVSRNSSMSGGNAYAGKALGFASKPAQNLHIVHANGTMEGIKVDLSHTDDVTGYPNMKHAEKWDIRTSKPKNLKVESLT